MTSVLVTGCAGFVGSHLVDRLLSEGYSVIGIDSLNHYYNPERKKSHLKAALQHPNFFFVEGNLLDLDFNKYLPVDAVFHLAAQAGVRSSWGSDFQNYSRNNLEATQRLVDALLPHPPTKLVFASTSSVYGNVSLPMREEGPTRPLSPYGVTKLACERLLYSYSEAFGLPVIALRYFTVYGPRQRPDMGTYKFIHAIHRGETMKIFGDGQQQRDFTYVGDVVEANLRALNVPGKFDIINVGGGSQVSVLQLIQNIARQLKCSPRLQFLPRQKGDPIATLADTSKAKRLFNFVPRITLDQGLHNQITWQVGA